MTSMAVVVKELRELTGAGILDCRNALEAHGGDFDKAAAYLREKGLMKAAKKADRATETGLVVVKAAGDNACAIEVNDDAPVKPGSSNARGLMMG